MHNKKNHIINIAFNLFYQKGIHAVGINEIIKTANIAKKTLYNHFVSKDALILETLLYRDNLEFEIIEQKLQQAETGKDALLMFFELLDDAINDRESLLGPFRGDYFQNSCAEYGQTNVALYQLCQAHKEKIKKLLSLHINSFEPQAEKQTLLLNTLFLLREGALNSALLLGNNKSALEAITCIEFLLRFKR
ncbi:TetR family transcriptional regulator [Psychromonas sp. CNPT3]|uniref:TetR/AcrR family transcriptional regulator n=1 Tax=Psychromonas sp. CNPT3 TaxID=314282 RepID=UPI00006E7066|nr:TetR/AcrR family transcriptional regulator [Psychromonas sp. CNPT3]AGH80097.1 TetR family transcriptional regulator [Psychromonas sp. CNPT3]